MQKVIYLLLLTFTLFLNGSCIPQKTNSALFIKNMSFDFHQVDMQVYIDTLLIVDKTFATHRHSGSPIPLEFETIPGEHIIRVTADENQICEEREFFFKKYFYAYINFQYEIIEDSISQRLIFYMSNAPEKVFRPEPITKIPKSIDIQIITENDWRVYK